MNAESSLTLHRQEGYYHDQGRACNAACISLTPSRMTISLLSRQQAQLLISLPLI